MLRTSLVVMVVVAACGDDGVRHIPDAPPTSGGSDASVPGGDAPPPSPVTLTATAGGVPIAGLTVYFQGSDSTLFTTAMTDASGNATGSVGDDSGFVTVIDPGPPAAAAPVPDLVAIWASQPGDHILVDLGASTPISFNVIIPVTGIATYVVSTTCGSGQVNIMAGAAAPPPTATVAVSSARGCIGPQDVLVVQEDAKLQPVGSFAVANQTFTSGGTADYHVQTYTAAVARTYTWNDDNDAATVAMVDALQSAHGVVYHSTSVNVGGTPPTVMRDAPAFGTLQDVVEATVVIGNTQHVLDEWGQGATYATDWGAHRLPDITSATYDVTSKQASMSTTGGTVSANLYEALIRASRPSDEHTWELLVLSNTAPIQLPTLPTTIYDWNVAATDTTQLSLAMVDVPGDPSLARQTLFGPLGMVGLETGASGTVSVASYQPPVPAIVPATRSRLPFLPR